MKGGLVVVCHAHTFTTPRLCFVFTVHSHSHVAIPPPSPRRCAAPDFHRTNPNFPRPSPFFAQPATRSCGDEPPRPRYSYVSPVLWNRTPNHYASCGKDTFLCPTMRCGMLLSVGPAHFILTADSGFFTGSCAPDNHSVVTMEKGEFLDQSIPYHAHIFTLARTTPHHCIRLRVGEVE